MARYYRHAMGFYETYIAGPDWREKRSFMLKWAGGRCQQCGYSENLEVHHRTYDRLGNERVPEDLEVLCSPCHTVLHGRAPRTMPIAPSGPSGLEKRQAYRLDIALREALGQAIARGDDAKADEIRKTMTKSSKRRVSWSRKRRRKEAEGRRLSDQRHEPPSTWETAAHPQPAQLSRWTWRG